MTSEQIIIPVVKNMSRYNSKGTASERFLTDAIAEYISEQADPKQN